MMRDRDSLFNECSYSLHARHVLCAFQFATSTVPSAEAQNDTKKSITPVQSRKGSHKSDATHGGLAMKISLKVVLRFCQIAVLVFGVTALALAQSPSSEVNGTVKDTTGAIIPAMTKHLVDVGKNAETTTSSGEGTFVFANV